MAEKSVNLCSFISIYGRALLEMLNEMNNLWIFARHGIVNLNIVKHYVWSQLAYGLHVMWNIITNLCLTLNDKRLESHFRCYNLNLSVGAFKFPVDTFFVQHNLSFLMNQIFISRSVFRVCFVYWPNLWTFMPLMCSIFRRRYSFGEQN